MLVFSSKIIKDTPIMLDNLPLHHLYIPSKVASKKLMIVLHGRGDSSQGFTWLPPFLGMEDMNYILLDAPYEYFGGCSWYDLPPNQLQGIAHSASLLHDTLEILFEDSFDASQSFLFGFSQGSLLTFEFGMRYQKLLAGYIAISGYIYDTELLLKEMNPLQKSENWLCTHGEEDGILPYETSKEQIISLQENGFDVTFKSYDKDHTVVEEELQMIKAWIQKRL
jgi:phospholipase/carboxylesterase